LIKAERPVPAPRAVDRPFLTVYYARGCAIVVAKEDKGPDHGLNTLGNPGNVG
jgi:hypothetical protein